MLKHVLILSTLFAHFASVLLMGQNVCANSTTTKLYCLIPTALHTPANQFNFFNEAFATQLSQLPLASPASGVIYEIQGGLPTVSNAGFGPIMTERAETIGRHAWYVAFTYQRFGFNSIDGTNLKDVPIVLRLSDNSVVTQTYNRIDATVNQYAGYATFGLTNRIDLSVAVPFERISMAMSTSGTEYSTTSNATASLQSYVPGSATGFGDVVLAAKGTVFNGEHVRMALGTELRLPSGDAKNFLGSGAVGIKPYFVASRRGTFSPHLNLGYQWNGNSVLATDATGNEQNLPGAFLYAFGADYSPKRYLTLVGDLLGQYVINSPTVTSPQSMTIKSRGVSVLGVLPNNSSYSTDALSLGFKAAGWSNLLVSANLMIRLNQGGLSCKLVPMAGISYTFK